MDSLADILRFKNFGIPFFIFLVVLFVPFIGRNKKQEIDKEIDDYNKNH